MDTKRAKIKFNLIKKARWFFKTIENNEDIIKLILDRGSATPSSVALLLRKNDSVAIREMSLMERLGVLEKERVGKEVFYKISNIDFINKVCDALSPVPLSIALRRGYMKSDKELHEYINKKKIPLDYTEEEVQKGVLLFLDQYSDTKLKFKVAKQKQNYLVTLRP